MRHAWVLIVSAGVLAGGCHTISEELPTTPRTQVSVPVPVVTAPPQPAPTPPLPPAPSPSPPAPTPTPTPDPGDGFPNNTNPVARVTAEVRWIVCNGVIEPNSHNRPYAKVGCIVYLDATPKDSAGQHTRAKGEPSWAYTNPDMFSYKANNPYSPVITALKTGTSFITCTIDGIRSNQLTMQITD